MCEFYLLRMSIAGKRQEKTRVAGLGRWAMRTRGQYLVRPRRRGRPLAVTVARYMVSHSEADEGAKGVMRSTRSLMGSKK